MPGRFRPFTTRSFIVCICCILLVAMFSCRKLEFSPYQTDNADKPANVTMETIQRLQATEAAADDTVIVLYLGDTHRFYDQLVQTISKANSIPGLDFAVVAGDLTDFGILEQFLFIDQSFKKLKVPTFFAIGNHDLIASGSEIYTQMFGEKNFSFRYKGYKFLFHDTNGREYNYSGSVPNLWWLGDELADTTAKWFVAVSHVPPYNEDFDKTLEKPYHHLFASHPNFILSMHGHVHFTADEYHYGDSVRYMTCNSVEKKNSSLLTFINGKVTREMLPY